MASSTTSQGELSLDTFRAVVSKRGFAMKPEDEQDYLFIERQMERAIHLVDKLPEYIDPRLEPKSDTSAPRIYSVPAKAENPLNAWSHKFDLSGPAATAKEGLLEGRSVAVKDTVSVAGVPFTCGTEPYHLSSDAPYPIPTIDAPVVARILEAGGVIKGTSTCENYCFSALSFTSATGPVDNPWLPGGYSAGGSSSGSATLVAIKHVQQWRAKRGLPPLDLGEGVDLALGGDQGGSIRLPAAFSGVYGLKPTHGLVPYTGLAPLHPMIDHCGPIAGTVRDVALLLTAIAGYDGIDPRQTPETPLRARVPAYHEILDRAIADKTSRGEWTPAAAAKGLRVGILKEGFAITNMTDEVAGVVRQAAQRFGALGAAAVEEVSVPLHALGAALWNATNRAQMGDVFVRAKAPELLSHSLPGLTPPAPSQSWYETMTASNPAVVAVLLGGDRAEADPVASPLRMRAKAIMHVHQLRAAYDAALEKYDVLVMPTVPFVGPPHVRREASVREKYDAALGVVSNTAPFNLTGHPGLSMPVGWGSVKDGSGKLPVGMQVVGKRWDESGVLFAAAAWEVGGLGWGNE